MKTTQSTTTSIILFFSVYSVSLYLLAKVLPQHNIYLTVSALLLVVWNALVMCIVISQRGKSNG